MKRILTICLLLAGFLQVRGQAFEGTIRWTMNMEITDPKVKADMEQAQKKMNDPATQAKMAEMEKQMQDPQMKAMMESNPQMKAQMEAAMKMMKGGSPSMSNMIPKGMTIRMKGANSLTVMEGGMTDGMEILSLDGKSYEIDRKAHTYRLLPQGGGADRMSGEAKVTKTSETGKVMNYNCTKYIVEITERGKPMTHQIWATTEIKDIDVKALAKQRGSRGGTTMFYEQIEGVPLKMVMVSPEGNMTMEVSEFKRESVGSDIFAIPAGYTEQGK